MGTERLENVWNPSSDICSCAYLVSPGETRSLVLVGQLLHRATY